MNQHRILRYVNGLLTGALLLWAGASFAQPVFRVTAIPDESPTELARKAVMGSPQARTTLLSRTPMKRLGEPAEVARVAVFLASDDASYMTGQTVYPDGGRLALNYTVPVVDADGQ